MNQTNTNPRTALLLGGSGLVGQSCLDALLAEPLYKSVVSVGRRELQHAHPKLIQQITGFDSLHSLALPPIDDVFCAFGTTIRKAGSQQAFRRIDVEYPLAAARQALKSGARQFVLVSSIGADAKSKNFYLQCKGEAEQAISALPFQAVHIFRPSLLLGKRAESRPGESFAIVTAKIFEFLCVGPLRRYHPISAMKVGQAMVTVATANGHGTMIYEYEEIIRAWTN